MNQIREIFIFAIFAVVLATCTAQAREELIRGQVFKGIHATVTDLQSEDGADLAVYELEGNAKGDVYLIEPGILETALALDGVVHRLHAKGAHLFVGEVRLASRELRASSADGNNGLEEVALKDFVAHVRHVFQRVNAKRARGVRPRKIRVFGHSMGGIEVMAALSDPVLGPEIESYVESVTVLAAPHQFKHNSLWIRAEAKALSALFRTVRKVMGGEVVGAHVTVFDFVQRLRQSDHALVAKSAGKLEYLLSRLAVVFLNNGLIQRNNASPEALRDLWKSKLAAVPLDLVIELTNALGSGELNKRDGTPLVIPENIRIPVQLLSPELDVLVTTKDQKDLFERLGSSAKQLVTLLGMRHVDPVVSDIPETDFTGLVTAFHRDPERVAQADPYLAFYRKCEDLLSNRGLRFSALLD